MPSTDIDGSPILIIARDKAMSLVGLLWMAYYANKLTEDQFYVGQRIAAAFDLLAGSVPPWPSEGKA